MLHNLLAIFTAFFMLCIAVEFSAYFFVVVEASADVGIYSIHFLYACELELICLLSGAAIYPVYVYTIFGPIFPFHHSFVPAGQTVFIVHKMVFHWLQKKTKTNSK